jgi:hypothetical protein
MRAWTIVLFILAIHACLAMINVANITDAGLNISIDTSSHNGFIVSPGHTNVSMPSSDPQFFDQNATGNAIKGNSTLSKGDFVGGFIESVIGMGATASKFLGMFGAIIFSIHTMAAPYFGSYNSWVLEGMVDIVFGISCLQIFTGRSLKTME